MTKIGTRALRRTLLVSTAIALSVPLWSPSARAAGCEDLRNLKIPDTTVDAAEVVCPRRLTSRPTK